MIIVLGSLLADYSLRLPNISNPLQELHQVSYLELGPGGAINVAIMAARFGLSVGCMGEIGGDLFGQIILESLKKEGIDRSNVLVSPEARTPVANVLVDGRGEPTYLGYPGSLQLNQVLEGWYESLKSAKALFSDGWAEHDGVPGLILNALRLTWDAKVPIFFDLGPGNPRVDNAWHAEAVSMATVLLATEEEAKRLTGLTDVISSAESFLSETTQLVVIKRGVAGCLLVSDGRIEISAGFPVALLDATGAGDSFAGAVIYGYLREYSLSDLGILANATGAAKVNKLGTGHNMPMITEINIILEQFGHASVRIAGSGDS